MPPAERSHLCAPVKHGCDAGADVGEAGVGDVIGAFVGAVVAAMRATSVHDAYSSSTARRPDWRPLDREA